MRRLIIPALLALGFHALLMTVDPHRLGWTLPAKLQNRTVTLTLTRLVARSSAPIQIPPKANPLLKTMQPLKPKPQPKLTKIDQKIAALPKALKLPEPKKQPPPKPVAKPKVEPSDLARPRKSLPEQIEPPRQSTQQAVHAEASASAPPQQAEPTAAPASPPHQAFVEEARPLYDTNPVPEYPRAARRKGLQGTTLLRVLVDGQGLVKKLEILKSCGFSLLDQAALRAVKNWKFSPGTRNDQKVEMWVTVPIRFKLENS